MKINCADCGAQTSWIPEDGIDPKEIVCGESFDKLLTKLYSNKAKS